MPVEVRCYTDPACTWSWGAEPMVRRLRWEFGDALRFRWVLGGLARTYGSQYRDEEGGIGSGPDCFADLMAHWLDVGARTGMPSDPHAIVEGFGADLEEVREIPEEARAADKVRMTEGRERIAFPTAVFLGDDGSRTGVWGWRPYDEYRAAALAVGAEPATSALAEPLEAIDRFGRCATREIEELCGRPRPVVEAELWGLARDWRLKPVPALTGTLWELP